VLGKFQYEAKTFLTLHLQLHFHVVDSVILVLDPDKTPLPIVGHFLVEDRMLSGFDTKTGSEGELMLIGALLSDFELSYDLAVWGQAAKTSRGIIFVREGSAIRTRDDLIRVVFASNDDCFASDASGGLFRFSIKGAKCVAIIPR
jgi:hypothetical protein